MIKKPFFQLEFDKLPKMSKEEWVLLILAGDRKVRPRECAALMNEVFFFLKEFAPAMERGFRFRGTGSGPYSQGVAETVDKLVSDNLLEMRKDRNTGTVYYSPTEKGNVEANLLVKNLSEKEQRKIRFAQFVSQRMGYVGTLQYLGSVHPEYVYIRTAGDTPV